MKTRILNNFLIISIGVAVVSTVMSVYDNSTIVYPLINIMAFVIGLITFLINSYLTRSTISAIIEDEIDRLIEDGGLEEGEVYRFTIDCDINGVEIYGEDVEIEYIGFKQPEIKSKKSG